MKRDLDLRGATKMKTDKILSFQFIRFLIVGVANTLVGLSVIYAAKYFFHAGDVVANAIGYGVGICVSFFLNSRWTFAYEGAVLPAVAKFLLGTAVAYGANLLAVVVAIDHFGLNSYLAQAMGMPVYTVTAYVASRYIVFRPVQAVK
ncbi:putative flippase GtrA [Variovorax boronicumulans]|uniref:Flippase GtrA n=1 Tax=Variovorax boronicumulans TaxID=436515 RepID=A0AAW8D8X8_9BURK|nr:MULTISPECIES: GtrA family protein [Variovorax]MDP9895805.1 putative flippase GtrA [Variovorax boronicumulans]MDQ0034575.1 putative flippase GtrA [Variovorax boronicumulans]MDQ0055845.1 putative flippase GtrA [Variovorax boronicumulans]MDQ0610733.1 putative flippase GtrA [Variovorax sp. W1I1]